MDFPIQVGSYVLDTLQIYFAWDDDLYTHLKNRGFGKSGFQRKTLPIIYSDNCQSTTGVQARTRKYVISPRYFGRSYEQLGWKQTDKETEPVIPSEKPKITISLINNKWLKFRICPQVDGKEQYHLEYSTMAAFGRLYTNWAISMLTTSDFKDLLRRLRDILQVSATSFADVQIQKESKQAQRELMHFVEVPIESYKFSIGEFSYANNFWRLMV